MSALDSRHTLSQYAHAAWTAADGRLPGRVFALTQTLDGALWVGTEFGLFRFDGLTFVPWNPPTREKLPTQAVTALAPAPDGGLWIGTHNGVVYWKDKTLLRVSARETIQGAGVSAILVDHVGAVWVGTAGFRSGGLCRINADRSQCSPMSALAQEGIFALFEDRTGNVWAGGSKGLYVSNESSVRQYVAYDASNGISGIAQTLDGNIVWTDVKTGPQRLVNGGIVQYPAGFRTELHARILLSDHDGALWIGTIGQGLIHFRQGSIDRYTRADGLSGDTVFGFLEDREQNVWVATERGLDRFRDLPVVTFSKREGLSEDTAGSAFAAKSGGVWVGTTNGLNLVQDGRVSIYTRRHGLASNGIGSLFEDTNGTLWVDSGSGLTFGRRGHFQPLDLPHSQKIISVAAVVEDPKGDLWLSDLERGMIRIRAGLINGVLPWSFFKNKRASALGIDPTREYLMIGFEEGGLALYQEGRPIRWYTEADGLGHGIVTDLQTDQHGATWIATEGGLSRLSDGRVSTLSTKNGLPCNQIHAMIDDGEGSMWLNTPCGLLRLSGQDLRALSADPRITIHPHVYGSSDGMHLRSTTDGYFRGAAKSSDGRLWFPVFDGIAVVDPRHLPENHVQPPVAVERVVADGKNYFPEQDLRLPGAKNLQVDYTAFSFVDPDRVRFRYKLEGYDTQWNDVNGRRQAFFANLAPSRYRFRVVAGNNDGVWNGVGATLDFSIEPAFYQTNWFRFACITALFGLLWLLHRFRLQRLKAKWNLLFEERLNERTRIARELHDTVLQNIAGFALQLDGLSKTVAEPTSDRLRELRREAETWMHQLRESISDLRSHSSEHDDFVTQVRQIGLQIVASTQIKFRATATGDNWILPPRLHEPLLRIVEEALRNAARHASATEINVKLWTLAPDSVHIRICDNGCGFDFDTAIEKPQHWGLISMRERAQSIGAEFQVISSAGRGTEIEITSQTSSRPS